MLLADPTIEFERARSDQGRYMGKPPRCQETAWGIPETTRGGGDAHWMAWHTGPLEQPGLQKKAHRDYPSPIPPNSYGEKGFLSPRIINHTRTKPQSATHLRAMSMRAGTNTPLAARASSATAINVSAQLLYYDFEVLPETMGYSFCLYCMVTGVILCFSLCCIIRNWKIQAAVIDC